MELNTVVSVADHQPGRRGIPNITLQGARFFGRPNFSGIEDAFKDTRRKFTVMIPNEVADQLRDIGYNVKTKIPTPQEMEEFPDREVLSHLKVMVDNNSDILVRVGGNDFEKLEVPAYGSIDRVRISEMDMEIRGWEYNRDEKPGEYSARLVTLVVTVVPNVLLEKYGRLI